MSGQSAKRARQRPRERIVVLLLAGTALTAAVALVVSDLALGGGAATAAGKIEQIAFGKRTCAAGWRAPRAGRYDFTIANDSTRSATISLFQWGSGVIVARLARSQPGSVAELSARLQPGGAYAWSCLLAGRPRRVSQEAQIPSPQGHFVPGVAPVSAAQLAGRLLTYRSYVDGRLTLLNRQLAALDDQIAAGDLAGAESAWLAAHLTWLAIGQDDAAYGAFGELGQRIDGTAAGLVDGPPAPPSADFTKSSSTSGPGTICAPQRATRRDSRR